MQKSSSPIDLLKLVAAMSIDADSYPSRTWLEADKQVRLDAAEADYEMALSEITDADTRLTVDSVLHAWDASRSAIAV